VADPAIQLSSVLADRYRIERKLGSGGMATSRGGRKSTH
jgi:hypothetical protein